jgi:cell division protein FtsN
MYLANISPDMINTLIIFGVVLLVIVLAYVIFFMPKTKGEKVIKKKVNKAVVVEEEEKNQEKDQAILNESKKYSIIIDPLPDIEPTPKNPEENLVKMRTAMLTEELESVDEPVNLEELEVQAENEENPKKIEPKQEDDSTIAEPVIETKAEEIEKETKEETKELGKYHVLYRKDDNKWYVKREGSDKILRVLETQAEAIAWATIKALNQDTAIVIHKRDGKIRKQNY